MRQKIPFVSFRLPSSEDCVTLVQHHSAPDELKISDLGNNEFGFLIAPFVENEQQKSYFIKPDCLFLGNDIEDIFIENLAKNNRFLDNGYLNESPEVTTQKGEFTSNVENAKEKIKDNDFQKVVLSKIKKVPLNPNFQKVELFLTLSSMYKDAFVYFLQLPRVGLWMGASPEPLLEIDNGNARTVSLAGTQLVENKSIDSICWEPKEIEEQSIVSRTIELKLQELGFCHFSKQGPHSKQAGKIVHLETVFDFSMVNSNSIIYKTIKKLHPTPSVAGWETNKAVRFISRNESHNRAYYTGFLGCLNMEKRTSVYVNLRCMQLFDDEVVLYGGAGITDKSDSESEWQETENKMETLEYAIRLLENQNSQ